MEFYCARQGLDLRHRVGPRLGHELPKRDSSVCLAKSSTCRRLVAPRSCGRSRSDRRSRASGRTLKRSLSASTSRRPWATSWCCAVYETDGCAIAVNDEEILQEQELVGRLEGTYVCPEGAAPLAAAGKLREQGWIGAGETVVAIKTGSGVKYLEAVRKEPRRLVAVDGELDAD